MHAKYGKSHILQGVSFDVCDGEIVALMGRNGVGRSTALKAIMGAVQSHGSIRFKNQQIVGLKPHQVARLGLGYVPENRDIFPGLTVRDNLYLGQKQANKCDRWSIQDMFDIFPRLAERADTRADVLSGGEQQMLTICRTLMGDPDLVMVDEPTEGLSPAMIDHVGNLLERIASRGIAVLLVEQKLTIALKISQRVYVMGHGRVVFEGTAEQLSANAGVRKEWLEV
ncbi:ABC transporter ATP-binding protein [Bradyrhizobium sp. AUGA SZCCT0222]|nr:ABC transporter ATP-binding protein [Bradyrhizobium sp. AUGA SZCCT0222]